MVRIDLRVRSAAGASGGFFFEKLGIKESYSDPKRLYHLLKAQGMDYVTFTDRDTIDGCKQIAHFPDTFISVALGARFPEDGCQVELVVLGIDEKIHQELQNLKEDIYEVVDYLQDQGIAHYLAHPLLDRDGRLTKTHLEKLLLLFDTWQLVDGHQPVGLAASLREVAGDAHGERLIVLSETHGFNRRQRDTLTFVGGSGDYSGMDVGRAFTEAGVEGLDAFLAALKRGEVTAQGAEGSAIHHTHGLIQLVHDAAVRQRSLGSFEWLHKTLFEGAQSVWLNKIPLIPTPEKIVRQVVGYDPDGAPKHQVIHDFYKNLLPFLVGRLRNLKGFDFQKSWIT